MKKMVTHEPELVDSTPLSRFVALASRNEAGDIYRKVLKGATRRQLAVVEEARRKTANV